MLGVLCSTLGGVGSSGITTKPHSRRGLLPHQFGERVDGFDRQHLHSIPGYLKHRGPCLRERPLDCRVLGHPTPQRLLVDTAPASGGHQVSLG